jgi:hypothetical protein
MTVSSTTNRKSFTGDGSTTAFGTSPVVFFDESELEVYLVTTATGASTLQTITTHYTVSGGAGTTGTVTMVTAPASTETLIILRVLPYTQTDDFVNNDINDAEVLEDRLDKLTMLTQQLDEVDARSLKLSSAEAGTAALTELPFDRASKFLAFDASKNLIAAAGTTEVPVSAFMETVLDDTTAADARTTLGLGALSTVTPGTGVATALAVDVGSAGAPVLFNGAGGTPSSLTLTNATGLPMAAQSDQETASSPTLPVTPGRQQYHPSAAKGHGKIAFNGSAFAFYNVSSVTDNGTGVFTVAWNVDFSADTYTCVATPQGDQASSSATSLFAQPTASTYGVGSVQVVVFRGDFTQVDAASCSVVAFGDQ